MPTLRTLVWPLAGLLLLAVVVWQIWPIEWLGGDGFTLVWALFGLACLIGPDEVVDYLSLRGQGYSSFTASEVRTLADDDLVRIVGTLILFDAVSGFSQWLIGQMS